MSHNISDDNDLIDFDEQIQLARPRRDALFISDAEMYRRLGVGEGIGRVAVRELEKRQIFPPKDPLFGNKRYWPAIRAFLDARAGLSASPPKAITGSVENTSLHRATGSFG